MATMLLTGGAGYVGSHVLLELLDAGHHVVLVDDLRTSQPPLLHHCVTFYQGDFADEALLETIFNQHTISAVLHLAASIQVDASLKAPVDYYHNNLSGTITLLKACVKHQIQAFIFSSTAAVYGPSKDRLDERQTPAPTTPYGRSKWMCEQIIRDTARAHALPYVILRYFNVAGADPQLRCGQTNPHATHLIRVACQSALGIRENICIYGTQHPTHDGTCVRDYIHVSDVAHAHRLALEHLLCGGASHTMNCGYGQGYSVAQVLSALQAQCTTPMQIQIGEARPGDVPEVVADNALIQQHLGWRPKHNDLSFILSTALAWEEKLCRQGQLARTDS